jgi:Ca-activated chloride channel family protein
MNEPENALKNLRAPAPDPQARLRAKRAAMEEFARVHSAEASEKSAGAESAPNNFLKGLLAKLRLSRDTSHGSTSMNWFTNRGLMAGAAGVGVLAIGLATVLPNLDRHVVAVTKPEFKTPETMNAGDSSANATAAAGADASAAAHSAISTDAEHQSAELRARTQAAQAEALQRQEKNRRVQDAYILSEPLVTVPEPAIELQPAASPASANPEEVVVQGYRNNVSSALESKREATAMTAGNARSDASMRLAPQAVMKLSSADGIYRPMPPPPPAPGMEDEGRDAFEHFDSNPLQRVAEHPVSTFSADVDTASYSFVRAQLDHGRLPQKDAVRVEEMINYFDYAWPAASSRKTPFKPTVVVSDSPWGKGKKLVHIGIKGYELDRESAPDANLVLLLDVSGSMNAPNKLPLVIRSMEMLLDSLKPSDTVGIVVYAGAAGTVLEPTPARNKERIVEALRSLTPGGSTAGAAGIERAYDLAEAHFRKGGVNRILLATDGDFNVGVAGTEALKSLVERKREKGVYLSVLGFGQGNYRDELAQALAQNGNGVAAYIDTENEARKVLVEQASGSLFTIASDVKLQVEFNPATVSEYRLVGYETRALRREDFNNDAVDAGDVGAGHTVTAIYELTPVGVAPSVDEPRYEGNTSRKKSAEDKPARGSRDEYGFLKIRYKLPGENQSQLISQEIPLRSGSQSPAVSRDVSFSTAVAGFAQLLRGGTHTGSLSYGDVLRQAQGAKGEDPHGYRAEFIELVKRAQRVSGD